MKITPKTVDVEVALNLVLSDHAGRVIKALDANNGVLLPTINQLMAEAWIEGAEASGASESFIGNHNPYLTGATK